MNRNDATELNTQHYAQEINWHHQQATTLANSAIEHAKAAGQKLLEVKAALPHGEFVPWCAANLNVSVRQGQRYMRAALGKPVTTKALSNSKNDNVSLLQSIQIGEAMRWTSNANGYRSVLHVFPLNKDGAIHLAVIHDAEIPEGNVIYTERGWIRLFLDKEEYLFRYLQQCDFDLHNAALEARYFCDFMPVNIFSLPFDELAQALAMHAAGVRSKRH